MFSNFQNLRFCIACGKNSSQRVLVTAPLVFHCFQNHALRASFSRYSTRQTWSSLLLGMSTFNWPPFRTFLSDTADCPWLQHYGMLFVVGCFTFYASLAQPMFYSKSMPAWNLRMESFQDPTYSLSSIADEKAWLLVQSLTLIAIHPLKTRDFDAVTEPFRINNKSIQTIFCFPCFQCFSAIVVFLYTPFIFCFYNTFCTV